MLIYFIPRALLLFWRYERCYILMFFAFMRLYIFIRCRHVFRRHARARRAAHAALFLFLLLVLPSSFHTDPL